MLRLTSSIQIGEYQFLGVTDLNVTSTWDNLTDRCWMTFPRKTAWESRSLATGANPILRRSLPVRVSLGYDNEIEEMFRGNVRDISAKVPVDVVCEDDMYTLKAAQARTLSYRNATLSQLLADILDGLVDYEVTADREFGPLRISNATPAQILSKLRDDYFVRSFFRGGKLYAGLAYVPNLQSEHIIRFERSVIDADQLEYRRAEDVKILLKGIVVRPDNSREEYTAGDEDGEERTFYYYNISATDVQEQLEREIERLKYDGYRGSFTTFGRPIIRHGDIVELRDSIFPEREGRYLVKQVDTEFGQQGYRQTCEIESRIS